MYFLVNVHMIKVRRGEFISVYRRASISGNFLRKEIQLRPVPAASCFNFVKRKIMMRRRYAERYVEHSKSLIKSYFLNGSIYLVPLPLSLPWERTF